MNLIRHELGFSKTESRFPAKGTCLTQFASMFAPVCSACGGS